MGRCSDGNIVRGNIVRVAFARAAPALDLCHLRQQGRDLLLIVVLLLHVQLRPWTSEAVLVPHAPTGPRPAVDSDTATVLAPPWGCMSCAHTWADSTSQSRATPRAHRATVSSGAF